MQKQIVLSKKMLAIAILFLSYSLVTDVQAQEGFWSKLKNNWQDWKTEKFSNLGQGYRDWQTNKWQTSVPQESAASLWSRIKDNMSGFGRNMGYAAKFHYGIRPSETSLWSRFKSNASNFGSRLGGGLDSIQQGYDSMRQKAYQNIVSPYVVKPLEQGRFDRFFKRAELGRQERIATTTNVGRGVLRTAKNYIYNPMIGTRIENERKKDEAKQMNRKLQFEKIDKDFRDWQRQHNLPENPVPSYTIQNK